MERVSVHPLQPLRLQCILRLVHMANFSTAVHYQSMFDALEKMKTFCVASQPKQLKDHNIRFVIVQSALASQLQCGEHVLR